MNAPDPIIRTPADIKDLLDECEHAERTGATNFPANTYEQGVAVGIRWLTQEKESHPLD